MGSVLRSGGLAALLLLAGCGTALEASDIVVRGGSRELRERPGRAPERSSQHPSILILALDGVRRDVLYGMLDEGELPELARLLAEEGGRFPHAHFERRFLSTLPSSTAPAWVTLLTGAGPAEHGVTGNEFFIREKRQFASPVPVTFSDSELVFKSFTEGYTNRLVSKPSLYQQIRARDFHAQIWVAMHPFHQGADRLLVTRRGVFADAFRALLEQQVEERLTGEESRKLYAALDEQVIESVEEQLEDGDEPLPDVLTVYASGPDHYAHVAEEGPDAAVRTYLKKELEPRLEELRDALEERGALDDRYVLVVADHGHTEVPRDEAHTLGTGEDEGDPPVLLKKLGLRLRPFRAEVDEHHDFQAVLAYQGALAYVYLADRSTCPQAGQACDWARPPRFEEDVLPVADAFYSSTHSGKPIPKLQGTLDMVLARRPLPHDQVDRPFEVYVGQKRLVPVGEYLRSHPHPEYVALEERLRDLAVGRFGERAGDVLLIANNGNRGRPEERYYFSSSPYRSWHGSPSRRDSEIPLIVAHPRRSAQELREVVRRVLGESPRQQKFTNLVLELRFGAERK